jgi:hypothetical protein
MQTHAQPLGYPSVEYFSVQIAVFNMDLGPMHEFEWGNICRQCLTMFSIPLKLNSVDCWAQRQRKL